LRYLGVHKQSHKYWLDLMNQSKYRCFDSDQYNEGPLVDELETRIAALLGKADALFFNKGTSCQLAALKVHCNNKNNEKIILHPQSHIAQDEQGAYEKLIGLNGILAGKPNMPISVTDIESITESIAVLVIELPLRRAGFKLPEWQELLQLRTWCNENNVIMHLDGARLWESANYYGLAWASIAKLFDSVYISLYKGLGGMAGGVLSGDANMLEQCKVWRDRLGSNMWTAFPILITALQGIDNHLNQINNWVIRAKEIAHALQAIDDLIIATPQTNGFQIKVKADLYQLNNQHKKVSQKMEIYPCKPFTAIPNSKLLVTEVQVGAQHTQIKTQELVDFFTALIQSEKSF